MIISSCATTFYVTTLFLKLLIFAHMANRLKADKAEKKKPANPEKFKPEKEAQVTVKQLVKDERTHKIAGTFALLISLFLFIAFASYLFTWREDQDKVFRGAAILLPGEEVKTTNLLGNLGAYISHLFFYRGFGAASFMFCSLFFVVGVNALLASKIFSLWRNVRYVIIGLVFFSVTLSFIFRGSTFAWGGAVGDMCSEWLVRMIGSVGTAALLLVGGLAYIIWRFNPVFKAPALSKPKTDEVLAPLVPFVADHEDTVLAETNGAIGNKMKDGSAIKKLPKQKTDELPLDIQLVEKEGPVVEDPEIKGEEEPVEDNIDEIREVPLPVDETPQLIPQKGREPKKPKPDLELEIKTYPEVDQPVVPVEEPVVVEQKPITQEPYDPSLDLRDYKFPGLDLLELHGSERIIQDPAELETNKNQIIETLKNYDIDIQKISATVGPTVTLYEIVPAAGVRISRSRTWKMISRLSLAALGIRIIAPIPGKGTIGIEVPNVKKTEVSMRSYAVVGKISE